MRDFEFHEYKFYVGQSAKENWSLLDNAKAENPDFIWFHLDSFSSPYVIMWATIEDLEKSRESLDKYLNYGASLCKSYSKYKNLKDLKIMYTTVKKLTKTDIIGEVDIKGKYKTLIVDGR
jgi:hypothetical protein